MTDFVYHGWGSVEGVVHGANAIKVPFGNEEIVFDSGVDVEAGELKIPASGGVYLARISGSWSPNSLPLENFATVQLIHVAPGAMDDGSDLETAILNHETHGDHHTEGYGDAGWLSGESIGKTGVMTIENPGYFEVRASQNAQVAPALPLTLEVLIVKF